MRSIPNSQFIKRTERHGRTHNFMKARQLDKIRQLGETLVGMGHLHLDEQASVLGLSRSTTWAILHAKHKNYGLSAAVIRQMLAQPRLSPPLRTKITEYIDGKCAGLYGHNPMQVRRFVAALSRTSGRWLP